MQRISGWEFRAKRVGDRTPQPMDFPNECQSPTDITLGVFISNESKVDIKNISLAYLKFCEVFWEKPVELLKALKPGKSGWVSLKAKKSQIVHFKIKYTIDGTTYYEERVPIVRDERVWMYSCIGLAVYQGGANLLWYNALKIDVAGCPWVPNYNVGATGSGTL